MDYALNALQQAWLLEGDHGGGSHVVAASSVGGGSPLAEVTSLLAKNIGAESPTLRECNVAANKQKRPHSLTAGSLAPPHWRLHLDPLSTWIGFHYTSL